MFHIHRLYMRLRGSFSNGIGLGIFVLLTFTACSTIDHFLCYEPNRAETFEEDIRYADQFTGKDTLSISVKGPVAFCNPVEKIRYGISEPIQNDDHHLTAYNIISQDRFGTRNVEISNQFTNNKFRLIEVREQPMRLLAPTHKRFPGRHLPPKGLSHFVCYQILNENRIGDTVDLKDQFIGIDSVKIGQPMLLCNPIYKIHNDDRFPPESNDHLVIYGIQEPHQDIVKFNNQFHRGRVMRMVVTKATGLCVPTKKREVKKK